MIRIDDLAAHVCRPETQIREVLNRIDASPYLFQVVVDERGALLGTITDGDIRRAMLHGLQLEDYSAECMHKTPKAGKLGDDSRNLQMLSRLGSSVPFLPIIDDAGIVREIWYGRDQKAIIDTALIMAGGFGRRLGERTRQVPKPLLSVGGRPILEHVLAHLESFAVGNVFVAVHHLSDQIRSFLADRPSSAQVEILDEERGLGTAGALGLLDPAARARPILVVNGDLVTRADLYAMGEFHLHHELDGTVAVARHEVEIPFGVVRFDEEGLFGGLDEKPRISQFVAAGMYYLMPTVTALVRKDQPLDMPELLNAARAIGLRIGLFPIHEYWIDVGRPDDLDAADKAYQSLAKK
jgi:dTDP-glucose pyrophosphorylase